MKRWLAFALVGVLLLAGCGSSGARGSKTTGAGAFMTPGQAAAVRPPTFQGSFSSLFFTDSNHGWVAATRAPRSDGSAAQPAVYIMVTANGGGVWDWVPLASPAPKQLDFVDDQHGWALTDDRLLTTADGGHTWDECYRDANPRQSLRQVSFLDREHGFLLVAGVTARAGTPQWVTPVQLSATSDGGRTWLAIDLPHVIPNAFAFVDSQTGWVAGTTYGDGASRAAIYATTDGGRTWQQQLTSPVPQDTTPGGSYGLWFKDANEGWAQLPTNYGPTMGGAWGPLFHTTDGGRHWERLQAEGWSGGAANLPGWPGIIHFANAKDGWIAAEGGAGPGQGGVAFTHNGGRTWQRSGDVWDALSLAAPTRDDVWVAAESRIGGHQNGLLLHSQDGGETWGQVLPALAPRTAVTFVDAQHGFGIGSFANLGSVVATADGGSSWHWLMSFPRTTLRLLTFADAQMGWVLGEDSGPKLYRTVDGGSVWDRVAAPEDPVFALQFFDGSNGVCITQPLQGHGFEYHLQRSKDGGASWQDEGPLGIDGQLIAIWFTSQQSAVALNVAANEVSRATAFNLSATQDGGKTWTKLGTLPPTSPALLGFSRPSLGWLFMRQQFLTTADGGRTWTSHTMMGLDSATFGASASFADAVHGWVLGQDGTLWRTSDGGLTWEPILNRSAPQANP